MLEAIQRKRLSTQRFAETKTCRFIVLMVFVDTFNSVCVWDRSRSSDGGVFSGSALGWGLENGKHLLVLVGRLSTEVICCGLVPCLLPLSTELWAFSVSHQNAVCVCTWSQLSVCLSAVYCDCILSLFFALSLTRFMRQTLLHSAAIGQTLQMVSLMDRWNAFR